MCVCTNEQDKTLENFHIDFEDNGRAAYVWVVHMLLVCTCKPNPTLCITAARVQRKGCGITSWQQMKRLPTGSSSASPGRPCFVLV